ncbi:MAG: hypothetical protein R3B09_04305 [Nannocystaceae bacterium]
MVGLLLASFLAATAVPLPSPVVGLACAAPELAPRRPSLAIDASTLGDLGAGPAVARQLRVRADAALRAQTAACDDLRERPVVAITVRPLGGDEIGYQSALELQQRGQIAPISGARVDLRCSLCTEGELVLQLAGAVEQLLVRVPELLDAAIAGA